MSAARAYASGAAGILKRDALFFISYRARFAAQILSGFVSVTTFYYVSRLVSVSAFPSPDAYFAYVVIGLVILEILVCALQYLPMVIRQELVAGTFERLVLSPLGPVAAILSMTTFPLVTALASSLVTLAFAGLAFGMPIEWSTAPLSVPVAILGAIAFLPFALFFAGMVLAVKQTVIGAGFVITGLSLVGGVFFPANLLPGWVEWTARVQPMTPALDLMRHLISGDAMSGSAWFAIAKLALFPIVLLPPAIWVLSAAIRYGQRRGTVIEY